MTTAVPILRTPRLTLRPLVPEDARAVAAGVGNYDVSKWLAVVPYPYGVDDAVQFLRRLAVLDKPYWAICDGDGLQGIISLDDELGYWLARTAWGKGYGFEAAQAVVDHWFSDPDASALPSGHFDGNDRSGQILRALGFRLEERVERYARSFDQTVMSNRMGITRQDWQSRRAFELHTKRLFLRPLMLDDAPQLVPLGAQNVACQTATVQANWSEELAAEWLQARLWTGRASGVFGIFLGPELVGTVGAGGHPANAGWMIVPDHWGKGFATEAMAAFLPAFFAATTFSRLEAEIFTDNAASQRVADKLGFEVTGQGMGTSRARLEPQPIITYALSRDRLKDQS